MTVFEKKRLRLLLLFVGIGIYREKPTTENDRLLKGNDRLNVKRYKI